MDQTITEPAVQQPLGDRIGDAPLYKIDFSSFLEQMKKDKSWHDRDRKAITVFKANGTRIILYAIRKGAEIIKQKKDGQITMQVLEGRMQFTSEGQSVKLRKGQILMLNESAAYNLQAKKKTFFLLTFTKHQDKKILLKTPC
jgi:quercetin dioxygenase-like cupin family protein